MKIEAGRYYRTRDGRKVGPTEVNYGTNSSWHPWRFGADVNDTCHDSGSWHRFDGEECDEDLIAEWTDPAPEAAKVGLPDTMVFMDTFGDEVDVQSDENRVQLTARQGDTEANMMFSPERARALAAALVAYADQAEGGAA